MKSSVWKIVVVVVLIAAVAVVVGGKSKQGSDSQPPVSVGDLGKAQPVTPQPAPKAGVPTMLELGSTTCTPCKMMEKVMDELRKSYPKTLIVKFINVDKSPEMTKKYKISVIPTQVFLDADGKEFHRHMGFYPVDDIVAMLENNGYKLEKQTSEKGGAGDE
jgi:thioredoxin 1